MKMTNVSKGVCAIGLAVLVLALGSRQAGSVPPTVLPQLAKNIAVVLPEQCCANTCWYGFGCCGCTGGLNCPCRTKNCSATSAVNVCNACCGFFGGSDATACSIDCNWAS